MNNYKMNILELFQNYEHYFLAIYAIIGVILSILIYKKANKYYKLSQYKGLYYFRNIFLYLFLNHFLYLIFLILNIIFKNLSTDLIIIQNTFYVLSNITTTYACFMIVFSLIWKQLSNLKRAEIYALIISILTSLVSLKNIYFPLIINLALIGYAIILTYNNYSIKKIHSKKNIIQLYLLTLFCYLFVLVFSYIAYILSSVYPLLNLYKLLIQIAFFILILFEIYNIKRYLN